MLCVVMRGEGAVYEWSLITDLDLCHGRLASTGRVVNASGTPVKIYPAPAGEPQNALPFPLLPRDFIFKMILIPQESRGNPAWFYCSCSRATLYPWSLACSFPNFIKIRRTVRQKPSFVAVIWCPAANISAMLTEPGRGLCRLCAGFLVAHQLAAYTCLERLISVYEQAARVWYCRTFSDLLLQFLPK